MYFTLINISFVDFDIVDKSNINRQVVTYQSTIGMKKVDVLERIITDINKDVKVNKYDTYLDSNNIKEIFDKESPDFIIDCCDSKETKKEIIKYAIDNNILFISSMGTGNKLDPSKLEIVDIRKTNNDPLAAVNPQDNDIPGYWCQEPKSLRNLRSLHPASNSGP